MVQEVGFFERFRYRRDRRVRQQKFEESVIVVKNDDKEMLKRMWLATIRDSAEDGRLRLSNTRFESPSGEFRNPVNLVFDYEETLPSGEIRMYRRILHGRKTDDEAA